LRTNKHNKTKETKYRQNKYPLLLCAQPFHPWIQNASIQQNKWQIEQPDLCDKKQQASLLSARENEQTQKNKKTFQTLIRSEEPSQLCCC
jgi:hypothetical protein